MLPVEYFNGPGTDDLSIQRVQEGSLMGECQDVSTEGVEAFQVKPRMRDGSQ